MMTLQRNYLSDVLGKHVAKHDIHTHLTPIQTYLRRKPIETRELD